MSLLNNHTVFSKILPTNLQVCLGMYPRVFRHCGLQTASPKPFLSQQYSEPWVLRHKINSRSPTLNFYLNVTVDNGKAHKTFTLLLITRERNLSFNN